MRAERTPRRANLATMVGSSLAVVAAGSLLAFSTLAEQAGLEGLATRGLEPAKPSRVRSGEHAITIPAPATAPPRDLRVEISDFGREGGRARVRTVLPVETPSPLPPREPAEPEVRRIDRSARVAVDKPEVEHKPFEKDGPPYGHAYGHYKNKHGKSKDKRKDEPGEVPVYARTTNDGAPAKDSKAPKLQKVKKAGKAEKSHPGNGKAKGHSKNAAPADHSNGKAKGHSNGKAKGHDKHAHKGKGKGHSKHGG